MCATSDCIRLRCIIIIIKLGTNTCINIHLCLDDIIDQRLFEEILRRRAEKDGNDKEILNTIISNIEFYFKCVLRHSLRTLFSVYCVNAEINMYINPETYFIVSVVRATVTLTTMHFQHIVLLVFGRNHRRCVFESNEWNRNISLWVRLRRKLSCLCWMALHHNNWAVTRSRISDDFVHLRKRYENKFIRFVSRMHVLTMLINETYAAGRWNPRSIDLSRRSMNCVSVLMLPLRTKWNMFYLLHIFQSNFRFFFLSLSLDEIVVFCAFSKAAESLRAFRSIPHYYYDCDIFVVEV